MNFHLDPKYPLAMHSSGFGGTLPQLLNSGFLLNNKLKKSKIFSGRKNQS
jgi:hypothetical protein